MANHVNTILQLHTTEEGKKRFEEIVSRISTLNDKDVYSHNAEELFDSDDMGSYDGNINNMGAKWVTVDEFEEDHLHLTSAWTVPDGILEMLAKEIFEVDSNSTITVEYEDEMPNFVGVALYKGGRLHDQEHFEWDEIKNKLNEIPELTVHWNEEEEDWSDEGRDIMFEYLWEITREMQDDALRYMLTSVE
jgi:hypothetical protein